MKISSYVDKTPVAIKLSETVIKANPKIGIYSNHKFESDEIVMVRATKYGEKSFYVTYFTPKTNCVRSLYLSVDFECTLMRGKAKETLNQEYRMYVAKNLAHNLPYLSMSVGSDPEIFAQDANGTVVPAFYFLDSKEKAVANQDPTGSGYNNKTYWDGFQAEFDTRPFNCLAFHCDSVRFGLLHTYNKLKKYDKNAKLSHITTMDIPRHALETAEDQHVQFGCMPSLNAYKMEGIKDDGRNVDFRSAGGHIHFGFENNNKPKGEKADNIVKALDAILGVACVSLFEGYDDPKRRTMYGLAGEYRLPAHGLEYRTLSNAWLMHPLLMHIVFDLSRAAVKIGAANMLNLWNCSEQDTIRIINTCNVEDARKVLTQNETLFKQLLVVGYRTSTAEDLKVQMAFKMFTEGVNAHFEDPTNIEKNWKLDGTWCTHSGDPGKTASSASQQVIVSKKKIA